MVIYLRQFCEFLLATFLKIDWMPRVVAPGECTTRFIFYKNHFNESKGEISPAAFMPSPKTFTISIYRTTGCRERKVWLIGDLFVAHYRTDPRKLVARADLDAGSFFDQGLIIVPNPSPHPRHADVTNWPNDKAQQKIKAIALAQVAALKMHP